MAEQPKPSVLSPAEIAAYRQARKALPVAVFAILCGCLLFAVGVTPSLTAQQWNAVVGLAVGAAIIGALAPEVWRRGVELVATRNWRGGSGDPLPWVVCGGALCAFLAVVALPPQLYLLTEAGGALVYIPPLILLFGTFCGGMVAHHLALAEIMERRSAAELAKADAEAKAAAQAEAERVRTTVDEPQRLFDLEIARLNRELQLIAKQKEVAAAKPPTPERQAKLDNLDHQAERLTKQKTIAADRLAIAKAETEAKVETAKGDAAIEKLKPKPAAPPFDAAADEREKKLAKATETVTRLREVDNWVAQQTDGKDQNSDEVKRIHRLAAQRRMEILES